ncbi:MAG: hypothetical protein ACI9FB_002310 [Candidatus Azotimanducaceae bacterium]
MSETLKWWSKSLITLSILSVAILFLGPIAYKSGILPLEPALLSLIVSLGLSGVCLLISLIMVGVAMKSGLARNRNIIGIALIICLVPILLVGMQLRTASSVPQIHDISTDTINPPQFLKIVELRADAKNGLDYELDGSAEKLAETQKAAYPSVKTLNSKLSVADAVERSAVVLSELGLEIVHKDPMTGIVEATDTTFWFGFKDDLVVRIGPSNDGSIIDLRSVSRVGVSDVGVNAARILKFAEAF